MRGASAGFPMGRTTLVVEEVGGWCKVCGKREEGKERRRDLAERVKYWRGLEYRVRR